MNFRKYTSWLDRKPVFQPLPCHDLIPGDSGFQWQATGNDPAFRLHKKGLYPVGWYMLTVRVVSDCKRLNGKLYVDYGEGFNESDTIALPVTSGQSLKRVCYFPKQPLALRFDPAEQACRFTLEVLEFSKLTARYACQLMRRKIHRRQSGGGDAISVVDLLTQYDRCFAAVADVSAAYSQWQLDMNRIQW